MADKLNAKIHVLQGKDELVTCYYGIRTDPVTGKTETTHGGIDLISEKGNRNVIAFMDGVVTSTRNTYSGPTTDGSAGNYITIQHSPSTKTMYKHLKQNSLKVKVGQKVTKGQVIAVMGNTGHSTGTHLHFDTWVNSSRLDPLPYLRGEKELFRTSNVMGQTGNSPKIVWGSTFDGEIKALQDLLNKKHPDARILADGIPGNRTYTYVKKYTVKSGVDGDVSKWVQTRLKTMGFYTGAVDGEPRGLTETAIKEMQATYSLTQDGIITGTDWYYLLAWSDASELATVQGNRGSYPKVVWGVKSQSAIREFQVLMNKLHNAKILADGVPGNRTYTYAKKHRIKANVDGDTSKWVQKRLNEMGLYNGLIDGQPRSKTTLAIKAFENKYGLKEDGCISGTDWYYLLAWEK